MRTEKEEEPGSHNFRFSFLVKPTGSNFLGRVIMSALVWEHQNVFVCLFVCLFNRDIKGLFSLLAFKKGRL